MCISPARDLFPCRVSSVLCPFSSSISCSAPFLRVYLRKAKCLLKTLVQSRKTTGIFVYDSFLEARGGRHAQGREVSVLWAETVCVSVHPGNVCRCTECGPIAESGESFSPVNMKQLTAAEPALLDSTAQHRAHYVELVFKESTILYITD